MAAFAYLLLPLSGTIAFFAARDARTRFHGLQAVLFGVVWPVMLYAASAMSAAITRTIFALGAVLWLAALVLTVGGRDPSLPGLRAVLQRWSSVSPRLRRDGE